MWEEAKRNNDFAVFQPYLEKIVAMKSEFVELWGYEDNRYDTLLDMYEEGMTVKKKLDSVFGALHGRLVPLLSEIQGAAQPDTSFLHQSFDTAKQKQFSLFILGQLGYDFEAGRLDETVHPFATGLSPGDVRVTTRYLPNDVVSALFGTIHECGHALYEQNVSPDLIALLYARAHQWNPRIAVAFLGERRRAQRSVLEPVLWRSAEAVSGAARSGACGRFFTKRSTGWSLP